MVLLHIMTKTVNSVIGYCLKSVVCCCGCIATEHQLNFIHAMMAGPQQDQRESLAALLWRFAKTGLIVAAALFSMLAPSQDWAWPAPWFIVLVSVCVTLLPSAVYVSRHNPTLLAERERFVANTGTTSFDKVIVPVAVVLTMGRYVVAGLQHQPPPVAAGLLSSPSMVAAAVLDVAALALQTWSVCTNRFFSSVVRVQTDRGHVVCSSGPYAIVRHPGYVAFSSQAIAEAVLLQSSWCMWLSVAKFVLLVVRTRLEDAYLQKNLPGYAAYAQQVRYRLVPGVW